MSQGPKTANAHSHILLFSPDPPFLMPDKLKFFESLPVILIWRLDLDQIIQTGQQLSGDLYGHFN
jgi:hypothetical protein